MYSPSFSIITQVALEPFKSILGSTAFTVPETELQIFAENDAELLFVHIREPEEIERFRQTAGVNCKTILVRRPTLEQARGQLGNRSDDGVAAYAYDAEFLNDGSLEELPAKVHDFLQALIKR